MTHARDWLAIHSGSDETREAVRAFHDKRAPDYEALRSAAGAETLHLSQLRRARHSGLVAVLPAAAACR